MTTRNRELASIIDASGNITAGGNLTVSGTTTTISSTVQTMADNLIELNTGASSNSNDLGLVMERGSTGDNALFIWDESNDGFVVGTTTATGTSTGNISFSAAPFTASTIAGTVLTGSTSVKTPLIEYTDGDDAITIADGGHITTGGNLSIGGSNNELRFYEGSNYVGFEAPALSADKIWVLPATDGTTGQLLKTDGSGNLSFTDDLTLASADVNNYTGNGSTTAFTLSTTPTLETAIQAYVDGVYQFKNTFSFSGTTFTFDTAPDNGALIEILVWNTVAVNVPAASSVTNTTLNASIITGQTEATAVDADHVLIYDASATALRKALVSDLVQTDEEIADIIGAMFSSNTETGITATYQDADNTIDLVIGDDVIVQSMIADNAIDSQHYVDGSIDTVHIADDSVTLAKMAGIARGKIIYGDASGNPAVLTVGSNGQVLKSDGTDIAWAADAGKTTEEIQDIAGAMFSSNTETGITATYQDTDGTIDLVVGTLNQNTTGSAATLTTARTIGGVSFDGSANIDLPGVNTAGNQNVDAAIVDGDNFKVAGAQGSDGQVLTSTGSGVAWEDAAGTTINNNADNRIITGSGTANTLNGESNFVYDGTNVGIGTSSPGGIIDAKTSSSGATLLSRLWNSEDSNAASNAEFRIVSGNAATPILTFGDSSAVRHSISVDSSDNVLFKHAGSTERMRIDSSGNTVAENLYVTSDSSATLSSATKTIVGPDNIEMYYQDSQRLIMGRDQYSSGHAGIAFLDPGYSVAAGGAVVGSIARGTLGFATSNNSAMQERLRIDSTGRVGINRTPAISSSKLEIGGADNTQLIALEASGYIGGLGIGATGLQFFTNSIVQMKVDYTGELLVNRTDGFGTGGAAAMFVTGRSDAGIYVTGPNTSGYTMMSFHNGGLNQIGSIKNSNNNATTFNTTSDYRLKENVDYTWDATTRLKQLKPARFNWISDDSNTTVDGFLAHEVSSIVPEAIDGVKDATKTNTNCVLNSEGNLHTAGVTEAEWVAGKAETPPRFESDTSWAASHTQDEYQSIDHSKLVPLLVKTIQELEARITALES